MRVEHVFLQHALHVGGGDGLQADEILVRGGGIAGEQHRFADREGFAFGRLALGQCLREQFGFHLVEFGVGDRFRRRVVDYREQRLLGFLGFVSAGENGEGVQQAVVGAAGAAEVGRLGDLVAIDQRLVQSRRLAIAEQRGGDGERDGVGALLRRREPRQHDGRQRHVRAVLVVAAVFVPGRFDRSDARNRRRRLGQRAEILIDPLVEFARIEIAGDDQRGVVGAVVRFMEIDDVLQRRGFEIFDAADARALVRMHEVGILRNRVEQAAVRLGKHALAQFFLDHGAFGLEVRFVHREVGHALGLGPEQALQVVRRHRFEVVGEVVRGGGVVVAADVFGQAVELLGLHVLRALEHQVFEQMREAAAAGRIVLRADVVPDLHGDGRARVVLDADHLQAVGERAFLVGNLWNREVSRERGDAGTGGEEEGDKACAHGGLPWSGPRRITKARDTACRPKVMPYAEMTTTMRSR